MNKKRREKEVVKLLLSITFLDPICSNSKRGLKYKKHSRKQPWSERTKGDVKSTKDFECKVSFSHESIHLPALLIGVLR